MSVPPAISIWPWVTIDQYAALMANLVFGLVFAVVVGLALTALPRIGISGEVPHPTIPAVPKELGEQCVEPTDVMRRDHMEFILHQRDDTVHKGIRTKKHSLVGCIDCHVTPGPDGEYPRIADNDHFCGSCHNYAAVKIDCFECHNDRPVKPAEQKLTSHPLQNQTELMPGGAHSETFRSVAGRE